MFGSLNCQSRRLQAATLDETWGTESHTTSLIKLWVETSILIPADFAEDRVGPALHLLYGSFMSLPLLCTHEPFNSNPKDAERRKEQSSTNAQYLPEATGEATNKPKRGKLRVVNHDELVLCCAFARYPNCFWNPEQCAFGSQML